MSVSCAAGKEAFSGFATEIVGASPPIPRGTVTTFTVVEPVQYQGQHEKSPYVVAAILLDGAGVALGQQRLGEIDPEDVRTGMRVEVEWAEPGAGSPIKHWGPNGEPDVPRDQLQEHIL